MKVKVWLRNRPAVVISGASECRYEKANLNNGKPDMLVVYRNTNSEDWGETETVAEFHRSDILGWERKEEEE